MKAPKLRFKADDGNEFPEWTKVSFGSLIREYVDKTKEENEDVLLSCAIEGVFLNSELFGHQRGESNVGYKKIQNNTLILSTQNLHLGNANVNRRFIHGIISPAYKTYHVVGCLPEFMAIWVKRPAAKRFFYEATTVGASQCRRNVVWDELYAQTLSLPSLPEQQKIASFLSTIDEIIQSTESELTAWQERKKGVMQKIFNREVRFKADDGSEFPEWEEKTVSDLFKKITDKNTKKKVVNVITNSAEFGLVRQRDFFDKDIAVEGKTDNYTIIQQGDFVYNPRKSKQAPYGPFNCYHLNEEGIVSPLYMCLRPIGKADNNYLYWYFQTDRWYRFIYENGAQNGARHDRVGMTDDLMQNIPIYLPSDVNEQKKIADCLSSLDDVINQINAELSAWKEFKKGLLQQMFV